MINLKKAKKRERFSKDGYVLIEKLLSPEMIESILTDCRENLNIQREEGYPKLNEPWLIFWRNQQGGAKSVFHLKDFKSIDALLANEEFTSGLRLLSRTSYLQLFETIIFSKAKSGIGEAFSLHNDVSFYPFSPPDHFSVWVALTRCTVESGTLTLVKGSHLLRANIDVDVKTGAFKDNGIANQSEIADTMEKLSKLPRETLEMEPGDAVVFDGYCYHQSGPNQSDGDRLGLSIRFLKQKSVYQPSQHKSASFVKQIAVEVGCHLNTNVFREI